jgi:hypothetical protein
MKGTFFKAFKNSIKRAVSVFTKDRRGYYRFGESDNFPNQLIEDITSSGTAKSCLIRLTQFTKADGFIDERISKEKANAKQTFDSLLGNLAKNTTLFQVVSFRVLYSNIGEVQRIYACPLTHLRRHENRFIYNKTFGIKAGHRTNEDKFIHEFDPTESPASRLERVQFQIDNYKEQIGDLVFYFEDGIGNFDGIYPIPDYYSESSKLDILSDAAISRIEHRNITKGFGAQVIITTGPIDDLSKDEKGKTSKDYFDDSIEGFLGENAAPVLHLQAATNEERAQVTIIDSKEIIDATEKATDRIGRKVCRHFNVAPSLVGFATAGQLGNNQELVNQIKLMNMSVISYQQMISNALSYVMPNIDWTISTLKLFDYIPDTVLSRLTDDEIRELYELEKLPTSKPGENETLKVAI